MFILYLPCCVVLCFGIVLFVFELCRVRPVLSVSVGCPFLLAPSVVSDVYFKENHFTCMRIFANIDRIL